MASEDTVLLEKRGQVHVFTLNRPERMNAFDQATMEKMRSTFEAVAADPDCRVLVITGAGGNFSAGGDVQGLGLGESMASQRTPVLMDNMRRYQHRMQLALANIPVPTIAAIEGVAVSGGLDMALCCDMRVSAAGARIGETYTRLGLVPGNGGCFLLSTVVGLSKAAELVFTGQVINGKEAREIGLVTQVVEDGGAMQAALAIAEKIAANAPLAVRGTRLAIRKGLSLPVYEAELLAESHRLRVAHTDDAVEGPKSFMEKRAPNWKAQ